jgi:hypothetical protein
MQAEKNVRAGDWFSHDSTTIDFRSLKPGDIDCGEYFDKGTTTLISGKEEELPINRFEFSGNKFAFEEIYIFRISDKSSRGWNPEMYLIMPVKYKSFVTYIKLTDLEYQSGKLIFLTDYSASRQGMFLTIEQSLENYKPVDMKDFQLKSLLIKSSISPLIYHRSGKQQFH